MVTTPEKSNSKIVLIVIGAILLLIGGSVLFIPPSPSTPEGEVATKNLFTGIREVSATDLQRIFPEAMGKPMLLDFKSKFCLDCKKLEPELEALAPQYPHVLIKKFDIMKDRQAFPQVFGAFKPTTVPVLVFVSSQGEILNVLYNYHKREELVENLNQLK